MKGEVLSFSFDAYIYDYSNYTQLHVNGLHKALTWYWFKKEVRRLSFNFLAACDHAPHKHLIHAAKSNHLAKRQKTTDFLFFSTKAKKKHFI